MNKLEKKALDSDENIKKAFYSSVVGRCVNILNDYLDTDTTHSAEGFEWYYLKTQGLQPMVKSINILIANGYDLDLATEYVRTRVIDDTFKGVEMEIEVKKWLKSKYGLDCRFSNWKEDSEYAVDLVGSNFAIQVKPETYKGSNPSLDKDKKKNFNKHRNYEAKTGKRVGFVFYDKNKNLKLERYE
jgi:hypothetical protein